MPRLILERHAHAPELNRAHVLNPSGEVAGVLPCPGCLTIKDARARLFPRPVRGVFATLTFSRPDPWASLNRTYSGRVRTRADALAWARNLAANRHAGGVLIDGATLPDAARALSFELNG